MAHEVELQALARYLESHRLKHTKQRDAILVVFLETEGHVTAEDLHRRVSEKHSNIGFTTVYRTLKLLCDAGLASERHFEDGLSRYEVEHEHHDHLVCIQCGKIVEFESTKIEETQIEIAEEHGFKLVRHRHELYGLCGKCHED